MKRTACLALLLCGCAVQPLAAPATTTPPAAELERQSYALVNRQRSGRGLAALRYDERVAEVARRHSEAMALLGRPFGHGGFDDRMAALRRLMAVGGAAENVAYDGRSGPDLARVVVDGWLQSPPHRANIDGPYQVTGIGVAVAPDGTVYFTEIFVAAPG